MADDRDFRIRIDLTFPPSKEGVARGLLLHIQNQMDEAVNINPGADNEEAGYCSLERCGHRIDKPCEVIENHYVE